LDWHTRYGIDLSSYKGFFGRRELLLRRHGQRTRLQRIRWIWPAVLGAFVMRRQ